MKLKSPLKQIKVTQGWGFNYVDFYKKLGMLGHNGIDFRAKTGMMVYAAHNGVVQGAGTFSDGGIGVVILSQTVGTGIKTIYYHLQKTNVIQGQKVKAGDLIGFADNTGKYTTGSHLHFGLKETYNGKTINTDNGYRGAIDPAQYFEKNWDKSRAYHRYERDRDWPAEFKTRFKNAWLHKYLIKRGINPILSGEKINAIVYGGWDIEAVINPAMFDNWSQLKKVEFLVGKKPFNP